MKTIRLFIFFMLMPLTACGSGLDAMESRIVATQAAQGTPPPAKYQTAAAIYLGLTLTPTPSSGIGVVDYGSTMIAHQQNMELTKQAQDLALEREKLIAEQRADAARATAMAADRTAVAVDAQRTAYAQATNQQATAYSQATATQVSLIYIQQTQQAHGLETQQAAQQTAVVEPTHAIWTQQAIYVQQTITAGQAEQVQLAVRRQEMKNGFDAYGPWAIVIFVLLASSEGFRKWLKTRVFKRDEHGKAPVLAFEKDGVTVVTRPDLMISQAMQIGQDGAIAAPQVTDQDAQMLVARGAQLIEAVSFLPPDRGQQGNKWLNGYFSQRVQSYEVLSAGQMPPAGLVDSQAVREMETVWKEGQQ